MLLAQRKRYVRSRKQSGNEMVLYSRTDIGQRLLRMREDAAKALATTADVTNTGAAAEQARKASRKLYNKRAIAAGIALARRRSSLGNAPGQQKGTAMPFVSISYSLTR